MVISGVSNRTANLYNNKLFSDVEYCVRGTDGQYRNFYAHKLVLAMAGEGFANMFYDPRLEQPARRKIIEFTPHVFDLMLRYVYTDKIKFASLKDVMNVFQLATCFSIRDLMMECDSYLTQYQVNQDSVFAKYDCALEFKNRPLLDICRKLVSEDTEAVFRSEYFCMASRSVIKDILKLDKFNLPSELEVIEAVLKWCKADCKRRYGSIEYLYVRDSFLPFCGNLRFLTLDIKEFFHFVDNHELLLTKYEIDQFIARLFSEDDRGLLIPEGFSSISKRLRCVKLADGSSTIRSRNGLDISQTKSDGLYSYKNKDSHLMNASPNLNQSASNFPVSNDTNNVNQTLAGTAKKSSPILSFPAQSTSHSNSLKSYPNSKQASYSSQSSGSNDFMKTGPNKKYSLNVSPQVNGVNNFKQSHNIDPQTHNFPLLSNHPKQVNGHLNSTHSVALVPARSTHSSYEQENSPVNNEPLFQFLPKTKHTPTQKVVPRPASKGVIMSYEFQLHEMQKLISSSCESDIKCRVEIKMLRGTILIHGIELKVKASNRNPDEEDIEVYLCINKGDSEMSYPLRVKLNNDTLPLPFENPIAVSPTNVVYIEVMVDDLKMNRCGVCRAQESMCELNSGLDVKAQIELRSNQSNGIDSFVFLISKILYSVPKY